MRRFLLLPVFAFAVACGGGSVFGDDESYPNTKTLTIELKNTSTGPADVWCEPEVKGTGTNVAAGTTRTTTRDVTWADSTEAQTFKFHAFKVGLIRDAEAQLTINGHESHAQNFSGFVATWDGTTLRVATRE